MRGQLLWDFNNFFGGGRRLRLRLKGSQIAQSIDSEFRQPYFLGPHQTFVLPLIQERQQNPGFDVTYVSLAPRIERTFGADLKAALAYNIEYDDLSNVPDATIARLDGYRPRGSVSSLQGVLEYNTVDNLLDPHRGTLLRLQAEQAGGPWHGNYTFYRGLVETTRYVAVQGSRVIAGRFRIGAGNGFGQSHDLPMFRRFFAGGPNSTRGYDRDKVGPLTPDEDPIGGRSLLEWNLEFRTPVYKDFGVVAFVDAGEVNTTPLHYTITDLQYGIGAGVRYHTIVGPLRLDLGFPIDPPAGLPSWQIYFSIGQTF